MRKKIRKIITIPEDTEVNIENKKTVVKGKLGTIEKEFKFKGIELKKENNSIVIEKEAATKKDKKMIATIAAHIKNMIEGANNGFEYRLQICSIHFPISVKVDKEKSLLVIKNFLGENKNRTAKLLQNVNIAIEGDIISLRGCDKEKVAQCAANIENATKIKAKDRRIYQDGIWIISKAGKK